eukprot:2800282-Pyramimonas_sp.AAC.1
MCIRDRLSPDQSRRRPQTRLPTKNGISGSGHCSLHDLRVVVYPIRRRETIQGDRELALPDHLAAQRALRDEGRHRVDDAR